MWHKPDRPRQRAVMPPWVILLVPAPLVDGWTTRDDMHTVLLRLSLPRPVTKDCNGVVPDCHGVAQNGSGSPTVTSCLGGDAQQIREWRHCGQHQVGWLLHIQKSWCNGLLEDTIKNLYNSMLRRLACSVSKHGGPMPCSQALLLYV